MKTKKYTRVKEKSECFNRCYQEASKELGKIKCPECNKPAMLSFKETVDEVEIQIFCSKCNRQGELFLMLMTAAEKNPFLAAIESWNAGYRCGEDGTTYHRHSVRERGEG